MVRIESKTRTTVVSVPQAQTTALAGRLTKELQLTKARAPFIHRSLLYNLEHFEHQSLAVDRFVANVQKLGREYNNQLEEMAGRFEVMCGGNEVAAAHILGENEMEWIARAPLPFEERKIIIFDAVPTGRQAEVGQDLVDFTRKSAGYTNNFVIDLKGERIFGCTNLAEYHWDLVEDLVICGVMLLDGCGKEAYLKPDFVAVASLHKEFADGMGITEAVAASRLNRGFGASQQQKERIEELFAKFSQRLKLRNK